MFANGFRMALMVMVVALASVSGILLAAGDEKDKEKGVGALPPHGLDAAFKDATTDREANNAILNNELYKTAVKEALKAKAKQEAEFKKNPMLRAASPAQAARVAFLKVLSGEKDDKNEKKD